MIIGCTRDSSSKLDSPLVCTIIVGWCQSNAVTELVEVPAIKFNNNLYRIKTTIKEFRNRNNYNKPYTFEVIKIELLDSEISNNSNLVPSGPNSQGGLSTRVANILQNVEKSYDKGKFLLEESKKSDGWDAIFRRF